MATLNINKPYKGNPHLWGKIPEAQSTFTAQEVASLFDLAGSKSINALVHISQFPPADIKGEKAEELSVYGKEGHWKKREPAE